jgi:Domain of unknown function (DUF2382)
MLADEFKSTQQNGGVEQREQMAAPANILTEHVISLLEERLVVELNRQKVGDIVVRKEIETQLIQVQVPIRREKLIVEQVSPEYKRIAEVDLGSQQVDTDAMTSRIEREFSSVNEDKSIAVGSVGTNRVTIGGRTYSPQAASDILNELARMSDGNRDDIQIEIVLKNAARQANYQTVLDRYTQA